MIKKRQGGEVQQIQPLRQWGNKGRCIWRPWAGRQHQGPRKGAVGRKEEPSYNCCCPLMSLAYHAATPCSPSCHGVEEALRLPPSPKQWSYPCLSPLLPA